MYESLGPLINVFFKCSSSVTLFMRMVQLKVTGLDSTSEPSAVNMLDILI